MTRWRWQWRWRSFSEGVALCESVSVISANNYTSIRHRRRDLSASSCYPAETPHQLLNEALIPSAKSGLAAFNSRAGVSWQVTVFIHPDEGVSARTETRRSDKEASLGLSKQTRTWFLLRTCLGPFLNELKGWGGADKLKKRHVVFVRSWSASTHIPDELFHTASLIC